MLFCNIKTWQYENTKFSDGDSVLEGIDCAYMPPRVWENSGSHCKLGVFSNIVEVPMLYLVDLGKIEAIFHKFAFISAVERVV